MTDCDLSTPASDWIIEHPETLPLFQEWGIDYTCPGKSLEYACYQKQLDPTQTLARLLRSLDPPPPDQQNRHRLR